MENDNIRLAVYCTGVCPTLVEPHHLADFVHGGFRSSAARTRRPWVSSIIRSSISISIWTTLLIGLKTGVSNG